MCDLIVYMTLEPSQPCLLVLYVDIARILQEQSMFFVLLGLGYAFVFNDSVFLFYLYTVHIEPTGILPSYSVLLAFQLPGSI